MPDAIHLLLFCVVVPPFPQSLTRFVGALMKMWAMAIHGLGPE